MDTYAHYDTRNERMYKGMPNGLPQYPQRAAKGYCTVLTAKREKGDERRKTKEKLGRRKDEEEEAEELELLSHYQHWPHVTSWPYHPARPLEPKYSPHKVPR